MFHCRSGGLRDQGTVWAAQAWGDRCRPGRSGDRTCRRLHCTVQRVLGLERLNPQVGSMGVPVCSYLA